MNSTKKSFRLLPCFKSYMNIHTTIEIDALPLAHKPPHEIKQLIQNGHSDIHIRITMYHCFEWLWLRFTYSTIVKSFDQELTCPSISQTKTNTP